MPHPSEVIRFVRDHLGVADHVPLDSTTRLEADLGVTGDDGDELLWAAESRFGVSFGTDLRPAFALAADETLFGPEGVPVPGLEWLRRRLGADPPPRVTDVTIGQLHEAIERCAARDLPAAPYLMLRPGQAFWVETGAPPCISATLQGLRTLEDAACIDRDGGRWTVRSAHPARDIGVADRALPWRRIPVRLVLGPRHQTTLDAVRAELGEILQTHSEFTDHLHGSLESWQERIAAARTLQDLIAALAEGAA